MKKAMKNRILTMMCGLVLGSLLLSGCLKDDDNITEYPVAGFFIVNGYPDASGVAISLDGNTVKGTYNPLVYKGIEYVNAYSGNRRLRITTNTNTALVDSTITLQQGIFYTSFVYGREEDPKHVITQDEAISGLEEDAATAVRFFNLADGTGTVSLSIGDEETPSFANRRTETQTSATANQAFETIPSGNQTLVVRNANGDVLARRESISLTSGLHYSIMLIGIPDDENMPLYINVVRH